MTTLDEIREREQAATEGPWTVFGSDNDVSVIQAVGDSGEWIAGFDPTNQGGADAAFFAHARTDIPRLLAALDAVLDLFDGRLIPPNDPTGEKLGELERLERLVRETVTAALEGGA